MVNLALGPSRNGGSSTRGGELHTTKQGGVHKKITTATVIRAKGRGKTTRGGRKVELADETNNTISSSTAVAAPEHISLGKKDIISFKKETTKENSIIFEKNNDQTDIIGKMLYQAKSTDQTNSNAKLDLVMLTDLQPDPDVVKPKGKSVVKKSTKRNDASANISKVVTYIRPGHPPPEVSIGNSNEPGIPLLKRVTHLIAVEDLNTEKIAMKVRDSILNVEQILNENAILRNGIWKLKREMWLKLDPYNFKPYNSSQIANVVQKMNSVADELGYPADAPERPNPPKPKLPINFSTVNFELGESSQKHDSDTSIIPAENSHQSYEGKTTRGGGGKTIRGGRGNRGRGAKTTTNNIIPTSEDQSVTNPTRGRRGRPKNSTRGVKTTNANQKTNSSTMETTSVVKTKPTMTTSTSSDITPKSTATTTTSTIITTISKDNKDNILPAGDKMTQQNKYRVETLNSYQGVSEE
ncbi:5674_t:CDS:2 [Diversispora eburnea]|uniref:5674_t:CDS:1 n=1 Tax=Diversispora eburnea TaxID=1213867 RepID=A0A9N8V0D7_9GLOM|nr:5674_t:CDS:2 [Diversispora eburnea]